ncbi:hypothetical protein OH76DRAFT_1423746 [Lentinus brumalis]|uniref:Uncharacterized protein n=1 Tax=Lentinus brumalis TaxID=2498619 RepID=A0A371CJB2_9APHY|nr:hypothetical protein OH76DRAFT_1423746 [Polyporus brumalis]
MPNPLFSSLLEQLQKAYARDGPSMSREDSIHPAAQEQLRAISVVTIHRLPNEVLIAIFKEVLVSSQRRDAFRLEDREHALLAYQRRNTYRLANRQDARVDTSTLIMLTHVCQKWRHVALAYPLFWTRVDGQHRGQLDTFIERSQNAPLSLYLHTGVSNLHDIVLSTASRLKRLDLTALDVDGEEESMWSILSTIQAPVLECFTLSTCNSFPDPTVPVTRTFLFNQTSLSLKALAIYQLPPWALANDFPLLTHLYIALTDDAPYPISGILDVLRAAPRLQYIHLSAVPGCEDVLDLGNPVPLLHLRSLVINSSYMDNAFQMLSALSLPRHAYVRLDDLYFNLFHGIPGLPRLPVTEEAHHLDLIVQGSFLRMICTGPSSGLWVQMGDDFLRDHNGRDLDEWLSALPSALPLEQVTSLRLSAGDHPRIFQALLPHLPRLNDLKVFFDIQFERMREPMGLGAYTAMGPLLYSCLSQASPLLVPDLKSVFVSVGSGRLHVAPDVSADELARMLATRAFKGSPIQTFTIRPFSACQWADDAVFSLVDSQLSGLREFPEFVVLPPSRVLGTYTHMACWEMKEAEQYWELASTDKPLYLNFIA